MFVAARYSLNLLHNAAVDHTEGCFGNIPAELLKRNLYCSAKDAYSDAAGSFSMTLHFYSATALSFIRSSFSNTVPHPSTLRKWSIAVDGKPKFTDEAFDVLHSRYLFRAECVNQVQTESQSLKHYVLMTCDIRRLIVINFFFNNMRNCCLIGVCECRRL
jgi:hypothetical protein